MSWLTDTLIATGALIALVLVLRRPVSRHFGPGMAYALWALPLLRLVIPPLVLPMPPAGIAPVQPIAPIPVVAAGEAPADPVISLAWLESALLALWLVGAVAFLAWRTLGYHRLRRELLIDARPVGRVGDVRLIESPATLSPLAFGLFDKVIALPPGFITASDRRARDLAIAHELEHHAGRDIAVNIAVQPLLALHWFNPLAWLAWRALRRDQEAACDARVVAGRDAATRAAYGALIADLARAPRVSLAASIACPVVGEACIVHRLRSLTMTDPTPARRILGRLLLAGGALILPLTASVSYASTDPAEPAKPRIETRKQIVIVDHPEGADPKDPKLATRVIEQDGKAIVLKTAKPLTEAEVAERIARAEASMKEAEALAAAGADKDGAGKVRTFTLLRTDGPQAAGEVQPGEGKTRVERRIIMLRHPDGKAMPHAMVIQGEPMACADGSEASSLAEEAGKDGKRQVVKLRFCNKGGTPAMALDALKRAREQMSESRALSAEIRERVLKSLDEQIARLSKQG